jgi:hypothetical protein
MFETPAAALWRGVIASPIRCLAFISRLDSLNGIGMTLAGFVNVLAPHYE